MKEIKVNEHFDISVDLFFSLCYEDDRFQHYFHDKRGDEQVDITAWESAEEEKGEGWYKRTLSYRTPLSGYESVQRALGSSALTTEVMYHHFDEVQGTLLVTARSTLSEVPMASSFVTIQEFKVVGDEDGAGCTLSGIISLEFGGIWGLRSLVEGFMSSQAEGWFATFADAFTQFVAEQNIPNRVKSVRIQRTVTFVAESDDDDDDDEFHDAESGDDFDYDEIARANLRAKIKRAGSVESAFTQHLNVPPVTDIYVGNSLTDGRAPRSSLFTVDIPQFRRVNNRTVFDIQVKTPASSWRLMRSYSSFRVLEKQLKDRFPRRELPTLIRPIFYRILINAHRRAAVRRYLKKILNESLLSWSAEVDQFLGIADVTRAVDNNDLGHTQYLAERLAPAKWLQTDQVGSTLLHIAATKCPSREMCQTLLEKMESCARTVDIPRMSFTVIDVQNKYGHTALILACMHGHIEVVKYLVESGALLDTQDLAGLTALMCAAMNGQVDIATVLLKGKADLNVADSRLETALHHACASGHAAIVQLLLDYGASVNARNVVGATPVDVATENGNDGIATYLVLEGAGHTGQASGRRDSTADSAPRVQPVTHSEDYWLGADYLIETLESEITNLSIQLQDPELSAQDRKNAAERKDALSQQVSRYQHQLSRPRHVLRQDSGSRSADSVTSGLEMQFTSGPEPPVLEDLSLLAGRSIREPVLVKGRFRGHRKVRIGVKWQRSPYFPSRPKERQYTEIPGASFLKYQPTADDVDCVLRMKCTLSVGDRVIMKPMVAELSSPLLIDEESEMLIKGWVKNGHATFEVNQKAAEYKYTVTLTRHHLSIRNAKAGSSGDKKGLQANYNPYMKILLSPENDTDFSLTTDQRQTVSLSAASAQDRDTIALTVRTFLLVALTVRSFKQ